MRLRLLRYCSTSSIGYTTRVALTWNHPAGPLPEREDAAAHIGAAEAAKYCIGVRPPPQHLHDAKVSGDLGLHLVLLRSARRRRFAALDGVHELFDLGKHRLLIAGERKMINAR